MAKFVFDEYVARILLLSLIGVLIVMGFLITAVFVYQKRSLKKNEKVLQPKFQNTQLARGVVDSEWQFQHLRETT